MRKIVGLCGYAQTGKTSIAKALGSGWKIFSLASPLKRDLRVILDKLGLDLNVPSHKEIVRPLMVAYGQLGRDIDPDYWVSRMMLEIAAETSKDLMIVVDDVRYLNEIYAIKKIGGTVFRIHRACPCGKCKGNIMPMNEEEHLSFEVIERSIKLPTIFNDGTPFTGADKILEYLKNERNAGLPVVQKTECSGILGQTAWKQVSGEPTGHNVDCILQDDVSGVQDRKGTHNPVVEDETGPVVDHGKDAKRGS